MSIQNEADLRQWLVAELPNHVQVQRVEPSKYGSSIGAPDFILRCGRAEVGVECKIWETKRRGIKCVVKPVQRQWHHMNMRQGGRNAILAYTDRQILVRGDHIPLRDYADDPASGCFSGRLLYQECFFNIDRYLFDESYGFWL